jgi:hypothetical protein
VGFECAERRHGLVPGGELLDEDRGRAHHRGGDDEGVVVEVVGIDERDAPAVAERGLHQKPADGRIAAAARAEHGSPAGEIAEIGDGQLAHGTYSHS